MDLLHHEMLKTGFLRCLCIPLNDLRLLLDLLTIQIVKSDLTRFYTCQVYIVACGSAYHVGMAAQYVIEDLAGLPVRVVATEISGPTSV